MSKVNLSVLPLFAAFAFVCSCSGDDSEGPSSAEKHEYCSYDKYGICLKGPFETCPGTGGKLVDKVDDCPSAPNVSSSSSGGDDPGDEIVCVDDEHEMCFPVIGTIGAGCPADLVEMDDCPYGGDIIHPETPEPVVKGSISFVETDYEGKYYVGSTVIILNNIKIENYVKAKCGTAPKYTPNTEYEIVYEPEDMVDKNGKLIGEGTITITAVAECAGGIYEMETAEVEVVSAPETPEPESKGSISFAYTDYDGEYYVGSTVQILNNVEIENYDEAKCGTVPTYTKNTEYEIVYAPKNMVNEETGELLKEGTITITAVANCDGKRYEFKTVEVEVVEAPQPDIKGKIEFKKEQYDVIVGDSVTVDSVTNTIEITNSEAAGCGAVGTVLINTGLGMPNTEVKAIAVAVCRGVRVTLATATADVGHEAPITSGTVSFGKTSYDAGTKITDAEVTENIRVTNLMMSGCDSTTKSVEVPLDSLLPGTVKATVYFVCGGVKKEVASATRPVAAITPSLTGKFTVTGSINASTSVGDIIDNKIEGTVTTTNAKYADCDAEATPEIFVNSALGTSAYQVRYNDTITVIASLNCNSNPTTRKYPLLGEGKEIAKPIGPKVTGDFSISGTVLAGTTVSAILNSNIITGTVSSNAIYTACPAGAVTKKIYLGATPLDETAIVNIGNVLHVMGHFVCNLDTAVTDGNGTYATVIAAPPTFSTGTIVLKTPNKPIYVNTSFNSVKQNSGDYVDNTITVTNTTYSGCETSTIVEVTTSNSNKTTVAEDDEITFTAYAECNSGNISSTKSVTQTAAADLDLSCANSEGTAGKEITEKPVVSCGGTTINNAEFDEDTPWKWDEAGEYTVSGSATCGSGKKTFTCTITIEDE